MAGERFAPSHQVSPFFQIARAIQEHRGIRLLRTIRGTPSMACLGVLRWDEWSARYPIDDRPHYAPSWWRRLPSTIMHRPSR